VSALRNNYYTHFWKEKNLYQGLEMYLALEMYPALEVYLALDVYVLGL
jgi:hypothetical protein